VSVLLALAAAVAYGLSDFIGGIASRRTSAWPVAFLASVGALVGATVLALSVSGSPTHADLLWGAAAGVGGGAGGAFLYRGLAAGRMGVVAPISGVGAAVVPVVAGLVGGERPGVLVWCGLALAMPGIWLVAREPALDSSQPVSAEGVVDGILAGLGFGVIFAAMGQVPSSAGYWPLAIAQSTALVAIAITASAMGGSIVPRARSDWWGFGGGLLATAAVLSFLLATQRGLLTVSSVVTSLYPAFTVLLASAWLKEHIHRAQGLGLGLCAVAVICVAAG
jgi:drug/metabolite transporter (DMT)-like permease